jgi:DNA-binding SARP family transcriptional activator
LAVLLLDANRPVSVERLAMALWGDEAPPGAVKTVQMHLSRLRQALGGEDPIETTPAGYRVRVGPEDLDAERFARLDAQGRRHLEAGDPVRAAEVLRDALSLWRGRALADLEFESFAQTAIAHLEEQRLSAVESCLEAELAAGRHAESVGELRQLTDEHPTRERLAAHLMLALYRCGRQGDALEAYAITRRRLIEEIGVEPGPDLQRLHQAILQQESSLAPEPEPEPEPEPASPPDVRRGADRRLVTVLGGRFTGRADPEAMGPLLVTAAREAATIVARHGGSFLTGLDGDIVGIFGVPQSHEDDVLRALRAADELSAHVAAVSASQLLGLTLGIGVDTGEVVAQSSEQAPTLAGEPISVAVGLARQAAEGEVLLTDATRRLAGGMIRAESTAGAWRLQSLVANRPQWLAAPIVGRDRELETVRAVMARAEREPATHLLTVLGDAGVGKTRLAHELATGLDGVTVLSGRCPSYGDTMGLWPLREALTGASGAPSRDAIRELLDDAEDADRIADVVARALDLGDGPPAAAEVPWAFRKLLETMAQRAPVLLIVDDGHWAQPPLLELLDHLVDWLTTSPVLLLCLSRPELLEMRPRWGGGHDRISSLVLCPLGDGEALQLLENHPGGSSIATYERGQILRTAEGNPFFIEQLLAMHLEDPAWHAGGPVPPTVRGLLAARLDRLGPGERELVNRAAVIGREFGSSVILDALDGEARAAANQDLHSLVRRGLIRPQRSPLGGEDRLAFHHVLIRDVAYHSTPKSVRCRLHEELARWLQRRGRDEDDEIIGYHLEQAFGYRRELESFSDGMRRLAVDAGEHLAAASRRAILRGDAQTAARLLQRSVELFEHGARRRPDVLLALGAALMDTGDFQAAEPVLLAALEGARALGDELLEARASIELSNQRLYLDPDVEIEDMLAVAERSIAAFGRAGDDAGLARAWTHVGLLRWGRCECAEAERELERALSYSRRSGRTRDRLDTLDLLARATVLGPRPVDDGIVRCEAIKEQADGDLVVLAVTDTMLAVLEAMRGRIDVARERYRKTRERLGGLGLLFRLAGLEMWIARAELTAGDAARAEAPRAAAPTVLARAPHHARLPTAAAYLARVYFAQDKLDEADAFARVAAERSWTRDIGTQVLWRGTRARLLARSGDGRRAEEHARFAVAQARSTDVIPLHADALTDLAHVLIGRGRHGEALGALDEALVLHERKGNRASADSAAALRAAIHAAAAT